MKEVTGSNHPPSHINLALITCNDVDVDIKNRKNQTNGKEGVGCKVYNELVETWKQRVVQCALKNENIHTSSIIIMLMSRL